MPLDLLSVLLPQSPPTPTKARVIRFPGMHLGNKPNEPWYVREARIQGRILRDTARRRGR